jgi:HEAT repeat protein
MKRNLPMRTAGLVLLFALCAALAPLGAQSKAQIVSSPLTQDLLKQFPEIGNGYIDLNGNGKADETADLSEVIPESRIKDGQLQAQEILDFIVANWRFIPQEKLKSVQKSVKASSGALGELIAIDFGASLDDAVRQREAMGGLLYLTPSAYKEAMSKIGGIISAMSAAYKKEGQKAETDFVSNRDALFGMIQKGYPLPEDIPQEEKATLSTAMTSIVLSSKAKDPVKTRLAIKTLGGLKSADAAPYLLGLADGGDYEVDAIAALGDIGYRPGIPALAKALKNSPKLEVRQAALKSLGLIGGAEGLDAVLELVKSPARDSLEPELLSAATEALAGIAKKGNTDYKILVALKDLSGASDAAVRKAAVGGLGAFAAGQSSDTLLGLLQNDKDPAVRAEAVAALNKQKSDAVVPALMRTLREKDLDTNLEIAVLLALGTNPQGSQALSLVVDDLQDKNEKVRAAASDALVALYPANQQLVTGSLTRSLLASQDSAFLAAGTALLAAFADQTTVPALLTLLARPESEVKRNVTWAFYKIRSSSNPRVLDELQKLVTNENESIEVRVNAVRAVGATGFDSVQLNLWQTLVTTAQMRGEKYSSLRLFAVRSLGELTPPKPQAVSALSRIASKESDLELRKEAVAALRSLAPSDPEVESALAASFAQADDAGLKVLILEALADSGSSKPASLAGDFLGGAASLSLKRRAVTALSENPDEASAEVILDACKTPELGDFAEAVLEGYPESFMTSLVARRTRTETDKNILSVLSALGAKFGE